MRCATFGAVLALVAAPAFALTVSEIDSDGDSMLTYAELSVKYSELTEELFADIDSSEDNLVDAAELAAALEAGTLVDVAE